MNVKETNVMKFASHVTVRCQSVSSQQHADDDDGRVMSTDVRSSSTLPGQKVRPMMGNADNFTLFSSKKSLAAESTKPDVASSCQTDNSTVVVNDRDKPSNFSA